MSNPINSTSRMVNTPITTNATTASTSIASSALTASSLPAISIQLLPTELISANFTPTTPTLTATSAAFLANTQAQIQTNERVQTLFTRLQQLQQQSHTALAAQHLSTLLDLQPASRPELTDGRMILVEEGWSRSLEQIKDSISTSLPSFRSLSYSLLLALSALNSPATNIFHKFWHLSDIRVDGYGEFKLSGTLRNNVTVHSKQPELSTMFLHPVFIPPEILLAGPKCMELGSNLKSILLKSDVYQLGILLLWLLRGTLPLSATPRPSISGLADDATSATPHLFSSESLEEIWSIHFGGDRKSTSTSDDSTKHPQCQLCTPPMEAVVAGGSDTKPSTAQLCARCWLDLRNLETSYIRPTHTPPLTFLATSIANGTPTLQSIYTSFLELLHHLLLSNPIDRPTAADSLDHSFFQLTQKWSKQATQSKNVMKKWRKKNEVIGGGEHLLGLDRANSLHTELNQIPLDPSFRRSGFKSVQTNSISPSAGDEKSALPMTCSLCHQPLSPTTHPSSPTACHCLLGFTSQDLYQLWKEYLFTQHQQTVGQWLEEQTKIASEQPGIDGKVGVTRANVLDAFPAMLLSTQTVLKKLYSQSEVSPPSITPTTLHAISLSLTESTPSLIYYIPLLPLYHLLKTAIHDHHTSELLKLWNELEVLDQETTTAGAIEANSKKAKGGATSEKIVRMVKKGDSTSNLNSATATLPSALSASSALLHSIRTLVQLRNLLRLYPASRSEIIPFARSLWKKHYNWNGSSGMIDQDHTQPIHWNVFTTTASASSPFASPLLRPLLWPIFLGAPSSGASRLSYALWTDCSIDLLTPHSEDDQIQKDVARLTGYPELEDSLVQFRLKRMISIFLRKNSQYTYWQGLHEIAAMIFKLYPAPEQEHFAFTVFEQILSKPYLKELYQQENQFALEKQQNHIKFLLSTQDPSLSEQLFSELNVSLNLFSIPWLLTGFTHVLAYDTSMQLWDLLLSSGAVTDDMVVREKAETVREEYRLWLLISVASLILLRGVILPPTTNPSTTPAPSFQSVLFELTHHLHTVEVSEWIRMIGQLRREIPADIWETIHL